jgi:hypothetical protein
MWCYLSLKFSITTDKKTHKRNAAGTFVSPDATFAMLRIGHAVS